MEWGQIQGQMRDPAAGCPATGMLPRNVTSATGCSFNPGGGAGGSGLEEEGNGLAWLWGPFWP